MAMSIFCKWEIGCFAITFFLAVSKLGTLNGQELTSNVTSTDITTDDSERVECGYPGKPLNGILKPVKDRYFQGDNVTYDCEIGHRIRGNETRTCLPSGIWSGTIPVCLDAIKVEPSQVTGSMPTTELQNSAYHLFDRNSETCVTTTKDKALKFSIKLDRQYYIVAITLVPKKPEGSPSLSGMKPKTPDIELKISAFGNRTRPWSVVDRYHFDDAPLGFTYRIKDGELISRNVIEVEDIVKNRVSFSMCEILLWAIDDIPGCGDPEIPLHSKITYSNDKQTVFYSCESGYEAVGSITRYCIQNRGIWSGGQTMECTEFKKNTKTAIENIKSCGEPARSRHSKVTYSKDRKTVFYSCDSGYEVVGEPIRTCQENGEWSGQEILCIKNETNIILPVVKEPSAEKIQSVKSMQMALKEVKQDTNKGEIWKGVAITGISCFLLTLATFIIISLVKRQKYYASYRHSTLKQSEESGSIASARSGNSIYFENPPLL